MSRLMVLAALIAMVAVAGISGEYAHMVKDRQEKLQRVQARIREMELEKERLEERVRALTHDPEAVEEALRRRLNYVRPGERVLAWTERITP